MASITSVISFFILLATFCYSLPIEDQFHTSTIPTTKIQFTTDKTIVDDANVNMRLISDEEATDIPKIQFENTTPKDVSRLSRLNEDFLDTSSSSDLTQHNERFEDDFLATTMETSIQFEQRTIRGDHHKLNEEEEKEFTTVETIHNQHEVDAIEMTTVVEPFSTTLSVEYKSYTYEPSTSSDSFGKYTGLLIDDDDETTKSSDHEIHSAEHEDDHSSEESKSEMLSKNQEITKTIAIIPGKVTRTEIFTEISNKSFNMKQDEQKQLTQGEK